jgi:hypothetical protein
MSDTSLGPLETQPPVPNTYNPIFTTGGMTPGMVVAASATANHVVPADASDASTAYAVGMFLGPAPSSAGERGNTRYSGIVSLTAAEWIDATEEGTVLTPGVPYFVSASDPGKITKTPPSAEGDVPMQVAVAISPLSLMVQIGAEGIVGPQGPAGPAASPTTEYLDGPGGNPFAVVADPTVDVTFIGYGTPFSHAGNVSLADGTEDGFEKTFLVGGLNDGVVTITPAHFNGPGTLLTIAAGTNGAAKLVWSEDAGLWSVVSLYVIATA